jgi:hypothetical protein
VAANIHQLSGRVERASITVRRNRLISRTTAAERDEHDQEDEQNSSCPEAKSVGATDRLWSCVSYHQ